jgi:hypothetical protein
MGIPAPGAAPDSRKAVHEVEVEVAGVLEAANEADAEHGPQPGTADTWKAWQDAAEPLTTIVNWLWKNAAAGILLVGAFLVVKGFVLSKGNVSVALGILQNAGLTTVVVGGFLSGLPILVAAMLATTIYHGITRVQGANTRWRAPDRSRLWPACKGMGGNFRQNLAQPTLPGSYLRVSPLTVVMLAAALLCAAITPWSVMVAAVVIGLGIGVIQCTCLKWLRGATYLAAALIGVVAVIATLYTVWLPHEEMTITGVKKPVVGYVLADDPGGWISILVSGQHGIAWYRDSAVTMREPCEPAPYGIWSQLTDAATLWQEITKAPGLSSLHPAVESACPRYAEAQ